MMKTRYTAAVIIVATLIFAVAINFTSASNSQNITPPFATSRYLMFGGDFHVAPELKKGDVVKETGVFRIDTYTGKVWMLKAKVLSNGERAQAWQLIPDQN